MKISGPLKYHSTEVIFLLQQGLNIDQVYSYAFLLNSPGNYPGYLNYS